MGLVSLIIYFYGKVERENKRLKYLHVTTNGSSLNYI
ncbi:unnamed protein product, partial [Vitis vinifera]|uniref:Uncharacterized protein n=1 Tax=Vitis vinifera TaxID=29760 RepID=E0CR98_VITVI